MQHARYSVLIGLLIDEFHNRFADFKNYIDEIKLFADPFGIDINVAPDILQVQLIEIQNNSDIRRAFGEHDLSAFYGRYVLFETYQNLTKHVLRFIFDL